jgi:uncharacterized protein YxeA
MDSKEVRKRNYLNLKKKKCAFNNFENVEKNDRTFEK